MTFLDYTGLTKLWDKIKSVFLKKSGDTMTGRLTLERPLSQVITGTGIYAVTTSPYYPARWKFNLGIANPTPGDQLLIKLPVAGHDYGCFISTDNGTTYYPVARSTGTTRLATQYGAGACVLVVFEEYVSGNNNAGRVDNVFPPTGGTSRQNYTIGCWRLVNTLDDNDQYGVTEAYCSTGASTAAKTATSVGYSLSAMNNIPFRIRFTNANSAKSLLTLSINSQTAKNIYIDGAVSSSSNYTIPAGVYWCYYDGTQFQLWTDGSIPAPKGLRGNAATASAAEPGSELETSIDNKISKVNSATMLNFPVFGSDGSLLDSGKNAASFMLNNYVEGVFMPNTEQKTYIDVGMYDYAHDEPIDEPQDGKLVGGLSSIVFYSPQSWNPGIHGARDYVIYCTGFTQDRNEDFTLEGVISGFLGGQKPARRFRLYVVNVLDYTLTISFIKNRPSSSTLGDIDIVSNVSEITNELKVVVAPHRTAIVDVCIPKFGGLNVESSHPVVFINVLQQSQRLCDTSSTQKAYNFNDFTESGIYSLYIYGPNASTPSTNIPGTISGRCTLQVMNSNGYIVQTVYDERMYYRVRTTRLSWSAWKMMTIESIT